MFCGPKDIALAINHSIYLSLPLIILIYIELKVKFISMQNQNKNWAPEMESKQQLILQFLPAVMNHHLIPQPIQALFASIDSLSHPINTINTQMKTAAIHTHIYR